MLERIRELLGSSQPQPGQSEEMKKGKRPDDPIKQAVLLFLVLFLAQMSLVSLAGGIIVSFVNVTAAGSLFGIFGVLMTGLISIVKKLL